ncbi:2-oxoacid:acceptor oxidoreductase family protein [Parvibacter caecicola]|uniref:2-oxoacid:acceptor oxidoreductase family protein n=1 Tax=Parvibacter caecicola TaxID=747645 RepID=UPI00249AC37D|nr:2-oxoacid:acceptor oxidoreductase family protein [Parvibacter caecicola]
MIEVLWHGRGGQGAFTAARLLGAAASLEEGAHTLAFPSFGPERRGAPMRAFTKFSREPIGDRSAIEQADFVVYLDETLLQPGWQQELKPGGRVLVNSCQHFGNERIVAIDANGISMALLGRPIPNTVFLGALTVLCPSVTEAAVKEAIAQYMPEKLHQKNWAVVDEAVRTMSAAAEILSLPKEQPETAFSAQPIAESSQAVAISGADSLLAKKTQTEPLPHEGLPKAHCRSAASSPVAPGIRCRLRDSADAAAPSLNPAEFAKNTCYAAGHLVTKNAGWRNQRPVIDGAACTLCLQCYLYCPDGTIFKVRDEGGQTAGLSIDYDFCKGCGVCARVCRFGAIAMVDEAQALAVEKGGTR